MTNARIIFNKIIKFYWEGFFTRGTIENTWADVVKGAIVILVKNVIIVWIKDQDSIL